jgi:uncharacterized protein
MKIIDMHAHCFPDSIAKQAVASLRKEGEFEPCCDGTAAGLREFMKKDGIAVSVNLPVATKKEQVAGVNRKMIEFNRTSPGDIICYGAMHPDYRKVGNVREEIHFISEHGIKGIKLHPEYQQFYPDDPALAELYEACRDYRVIVHLHAGFDFPYPEHIRATPERLKQVLAVKGLTVVFAHLGGYRMWDGVLKHLAGTESFFDTGFTHQIRPETFREILACHGEDRIVFGTDFPWMTAGVIRKVVEKSVADEQVREKIFFRNAERLLGIPSAAEDAPDGGRKTA